MTAVKGGLIVSSDLGQMTYFNTSALINNRYGEQMFNNPDDPSLRVYMREIRGKAASGSEQYVQTSESRYTWGSYVLARDPN